MNQEKYAKAYNEAKKIVDRMSLNEVTAECRKVGASHPQQLIQRKAKKIYFAS